MNLDDLAALMGKTRQEVEEMLKSTDDIELNLKEGKQKQTKEVGKIEVLN